MPERSETVPESLRQAMPDSWVHHLLAEGRVLLLLDGLDEVHPRKRRNVERMGGETPRCSSSIGRSVTNWRPRRLSKSCIGLMLDSADKPHWHDVVVMTDAHARPAERTQILLALLDRAGPSPSIISPGPRPRPTRLSRSARAWASLGSAGS